MSNHKFLNLLDIYNKFVYEWYFSTDHVRWQSAARIFLGDLKFYETGQRYTSHINVDNFEKRIDALYDHVNHQKEFSFSYPLCVKDDQCCTVLEQGKLLFSPQGAPVKLAGAIKPVSKITAQKQTNAKKDKLTGHLSRSAITEQVANMQTMEVSDPAFAALLQVAFIQTPLVGIRYGIDQMNDVIKQAGECIKNAIRDQDILGRLSGNSFGIILPNTKQQEMVMVAKKLIDTINDANIKFSENEPAIQISATGGLAFPIGAKLPVEKIIQSAEAALMNAQSIKKLAVTPSQQSVRETDKDQSKAKNRAKAIKS